MKRRAKLATTIKKDGTVTFENFVPSSDEASWNYQKDIWDGRLDESDNSYWVYVDIEYDDEDI
jgi:hypothetical protein